jgi:hypothetical protein
MTSDRQALELFALSTREESAARDLNMHVLGDRKDVNHFQHRLWEA